MKKDNYLYLELYQTNNYFTLLGGKTTFDKKRKELDNLDVNRICGPKLDLSSKYITCFYIEESELKRILKENK